MAIFGKGNVGSDVNDSEAEVLDSVAEVADLETEVMLKDCTRCMKQPEGFTKDDVFLFKCPSCGIQASTVEEWNRLML